MWRCRPLRSGECFLRPPIGQAGFVTRYAGSLDCIEKYSYQFVIKLKLPQKTFHPCALAGRRSVDFFPVTRLSRRPQAVTHSTYDKNIVSGTLSIIINKLLYVNKILETMQTQVTKKIDFKDKNLLIGLDVHKKSWSVTILVEGIEHRTFTQPPDPKSLYNYLRRMFPGGTYYSAYEAGFCGYGIHVFDREMEELRSLNRTRFYLMHDLRRSKNRIKKLSSVLRRANPAGIR